MSKSIQCLECVHYELFNNCKAFKNGIPGEIRGGEFTHNKKFPGQKNNILFKPMKENKK